MEFSILYRDRAAAIIHHVDDSGIWATKNRSILYKKSHSDKYIKLTDFPFSPIKDFFAPIRIMARFLRTDKCALFHTSQNKLLAIRDSVVYRLDNKKLTPLFKIQGDCVLHMGICEATDGNIYFGEYFYNRDNAEVNIWWLNAALDSYEIAYTFGTDSIRHIHRIFSDPFIKGRIWATTGDFSGQCYFYYTDDGFKSIQRIGDGTQRYRAVTLFFTPERIFWLTDSNLEQNYIMSLCRNTLEVTAHGRLNAPVWYGTTTTDNKYIAATTVEKGAGVQTDSAALMISDDLINWQEAALFKKDALPHIFKNGIISFPTGQYHSNEFYIFGEALKGLDGISMCCSIKEG